MLPPRPVIEAPVVGLCSGPVLTAITNSVKGIYGSAGYVETGVVRHVLIGVLIVLHKPNI